MKIKWTLAPALLVLTLLAAPVWAVHPDERSEVENLQRRIEALEAEQEKPRESFILETLSKRVRLSGLLELEAFYHKQQGAAESSDLTLATAQLEVEGVINDHIGGHLILLHQKGADESLVVDQAVLTLSCPDTVHSGHFHLAAGKLYLPFGKFNSYFISDPLTLELGETNNTALFVGWALSDRIDLKAGIFSGETDTVGDHDTIDSFVVALELTPFEGLTLGGSYLSDLAESDIGLVKDDPVLGNVYSSRVPGASAFLSLALGPFVFEGEYLAATKRFEAPVAAVGEELTGTRPRAWNLELAMIPDERWQVALRAERADDFQNDLVRYGAVASYGLFQSTVVALEYLRGDTAVAGNGLEHTLTAQLALEF